MGDDANKHGGVVRQISENAANWGGRGRREREREREVGGGRMMDIIKAAVHSEVPPESRDWFVPSTILY